ncbi:MAG: nitroreductase family protein [Alistipes sp.]|nr:nitroreductase family protein [Alistipes sp.]
MRRNFMEAVANRRSYYALNSNRLVDEAQVCEIVRKTLETAPSPFNIQSARIVVLGYEAHIQFWDIVEHTLRKVVAEEQFGATRQKLHTAFRSGCGTILFYEDCAAHDQLRQRFPLYADKVESFVQQSAGMYQFIIWTALEDLGYGASLQHYNPLIDAEVAQRWALPATWQLIAQMPYGTPLHIPEDRVQTSPSDERMWVF